MNKSEKTKKIIFEEAKKLFWNYGYSNVTVRQIAKAAKIDVALIPRYYENKFSIVLSVISFCESCSLLSRGVISVFLLYNFSDISILSSGSLIYSIKPSPSVP